MIIRIAVYLPLLFSAALRSGAAVGGCLGGADARHLRYRRITAAAAAVNPLLCRVRDDVASRPT
jgi:hypothetical protein